MIRLMFAVVTGMILVGPALTGATQAADAILLDFTAAHCPPCQAMKPTLAQLERAGVPIRHIDVVSEPHLASRYGIRKTPTYVVVADGKEVTRLIGAQSANKLQAALAIDPSGPLIPTRSTRGTFADIPAPQTRLAPMHASLPTRQPAPGIPQPVPMAQADLGGEPMPSLSVADAVQKARAATVRLRVHDGSGYGEGTGTIIDTHGSDALVLTCGHLFRDTKGQGKIEVDLFVGGETRTVVGELLDYESEARDIALVAIRPGFSVTPVQVVGDDRLVQNGTPAFSFGCDHGADPTRRDTRVMGVNLINQQLGVSNLKISGAPVQGRSGGGLFDSNGRLIGVCNSADYKSDIGIYAGPGNIRWQLDRFNLNNLYESTGNVASPTANVPAAQIASVPNTNVRDPNQEVIVIVRDRRNPEATSRVMTLPEPSSELMQMIQRQAR